MQCTMYDHYNRSLSYHIHVYPVYMTYIFDCCRRLIKKTFGNESLVDVLYDTMQTQNVIISKRTRARNYKSLQVHYVGVY